MTRTNLRSCDQSISTRGHVTAARAAFIVVALAVTVVLARPETAGAHAAVLRMDPAPGTTVAGLPERVTVYVTRKPPTLEGDPLRVYRADGVRVDLADPRVDEADGVFALSVGLRQNAWTPGMYHVLYRIVSADTHVITDHLRFEVARSGAGLLVGMTSVEAPPRVSYNSAWTAAGSVSAASVAGMALALAVRCRRRRVAAPPQPVPALGPRPRRSVPVDATTRADHAPEAEPPDAIARFATRTGHAMTPFMAAPRRVAGHDAGVIGVPVTAVASCTTGTNGNGAGR
jgi:copper resistance protein C